MSITNSLSKIFHRSHHSKCYLVLLEANHLIVFCSLLGALSRLLHFQSRYCSLHVQPEASPLRYFHHQVFPARGFHNYDIASYTDTEHLRWISYRGTGLVGNLKWHRSTCTPRGSPRFRLDARIRTGRSGRCTYWWCKGEGVLCLRPFESLFRETWLKSLLSWRELNASAKRGGAT